jgi:hypothetical protein
MTAKPTWLDQRITSLQSVIITASRLGTKAPDSVWGELRQLSRLKENAKAYGISKRRLKRLKLRAAEAVRKK